VAVPEGGVVSDPRTKRRLPCGCIQRKAYGTWADVYRCYIHEKLKGVLTAATLKGEQP